MKRSTLRCLALASLLLGCPAAMAHEPAAPADPGSTAPVPAGWWKGNTHTHSWWSDGDRPPEAVAKWYHDHGYNFLVLSDHNRMQEGEAWISIDSEAKKIALADYEREFGADWVERRERDGVAEIKLKALDEFRTLFEARDRFIFIRGMEITDQHDQNPVHLNGVNLERSLVPQRGQTVPETLQRNIDAVAEQGRRTGRPMFAHVNHPNFFYAVTAEDLVSLDLAPGDGFVEVYNGHSGVRNYGDDTHPSMERMWDIVLAKRLSERNATVMLGVATDDAHHYTAWGSGQVNPGRGWVMVRAPRLTPDTITAAMKRGDFYNSTGVTLKRLALSPGSIDLEVLPEAGVEYAIEFIGTLRGADLSAFEPGPPAAGAPGRQSRQYDAAIGKVLYRIEGTRARYDARGDELYVRARVVSTRRHPNPYAEGDVEMAWTQPLVISP